MATAGPLTWAAECRGEATLPTPERLAMTQLLLEAGGDPTLRNLGRETALAAAAANGHEKAGALLRAAGALDAAARAADRSRREINDEKGDAGGGL